MRASGSTSKHHVGLILFAALTAATACNSSTKTASPESNSSSGADAGPDGNSPVTNTTTAGNVAATTGGTPVATPPSASVSSTPITTAAAFLPTLNGTWVSGCVTNPNQHDAYMIETLQIGTTSYGDGVVFYDDAQCTKLEFPNIPPPQSVQTRLTVDGPSSKVPGAFDVETNIGVGNIYTIWELSGGKLYTGTLSSLVTAQNDGSSAASRETQLNSYYFTKQN